MFKRECFAHAGLPQQITMIQKYT
ncbi:hypothetical protein ACPV5R_01790 [Vibrio astriarenae]